MIFMNESKVPYHRKQINVGLENDLICTALSTQSSRIHENREFPDRYFPSLVTSTLINKRNVVLEFIVVTTRKLCFEFMNMIYTDSGYTGSVPFGEYRNSYNHH